MKTDIAAARGLVITQGIREEKAAKSKQAVPAVIEHLHRVKSKLV